MKVNLQALLVAPTVLGSMGLHTPRLHYPLRHNTFPLKQSKPASMTALNMAGSSSFGPTATRHLAVAGRIPWHKLLLTKAQALQIVSNIREQTHVLDLGIMFGILAFSQNIVKFLYTRVFRLFRKDVEYDQSVTNQVVENIRQAAGLGLLCYVFDIIEIIMEVAGIDNTNMNFSSLLSKLLYATWAAFRVRTYKRSFFAATFDKTKKWTKVQSGTEGKVEIVDKVTDFFLFGILALIWIDILEIKRGNGLSSIFALGGASTFVITLACQDLAKKVLNGLAISTSDVFAVGDAIQLGDGTSGTVKSVGWLSTEIRGGDEIVTKIPNTQLSNIRVSNLSRMRQSQVKQSLKFRYEDLDKIPDLVNEIREEIVKCCPKVITNGSKPFRVRWTNFGDNHLEVMIDCRLQCPPVGDGYFEAREGIMQAIARAVRRKGAEFVPPTNLRVEMRDAALPANTVLIQDV